jgi:hypothetical protein
MDPYLDLMRACPDDYDDDIRSELHVRVSVRRADSVTAASESAPDPDDCPPARYGRLLKRAKISPRAVEVRTPAQVRDHVYGGGISVWARCPGPPRGTDAPHRV